MNKNIIIFFSVMLLYVTANAQQTDNKIAGTVTGESGKLSSVATVILQRVKDSLIVKTEVTNKEGRYEFALVPEGAYFISVSALGYSNNSSSAFLLRMAKAQWYRLLL